MRKILWSCLATLSLVATYLNTDALIPFLRSVVQGPAMLTVVVVSIVANIKVLVTVVSAHKSGATEKVNGQLLVRMQGWIARAEVPAILFLTILPIPMTRTACTLWCSATQSYKGLVALLIANPIHVWTFVLGWDWFLGR